MSRSLGLLFFVVTSLLLPKHATNIYIYIYLSLSLCTKKLAGGSRVFSKLAGTQRLDRRWGVLCNNYAPRSLNAKSRNEVGSLTNDRLFTYSP